MIIISILLLAILTRSFVSITGEGHKSAADLPSASIWDRRHRLAPYSYRVPPSQHDDIFPRSSRSSNATFDLPTLFVLL